MLSLLIKFLRKQNPSKVSLASKLRELEVANFNVQRNVNYYKNGKQHRNKRIA